MNVVTSQNGSSDAQPASPTSRGEDSARSARLAHVAGSARRERRVLGTQHCDVRIGTSGWHYRHWRGPYYDETLPSSRMLQHYIMDFDTVEINNSFYRLPSKDTFLAWKAATPSGFIFSVKASRYLTHRKRLIDPKPALGRFMPVATCLGEKLGPILFQLPPRWHCNLDRLRIFLSALPPHYRYTVEFRDASWNRDEVYEALRQHNVAYCMYELAGFQSPIEITADFVYVRLHGPGGKYQGDYSAAMLEQWASRIEEWRKKLQAVYVYFDNDEAAYAVKNARELQALVAA